jgi:protein-disulfide isomerase
VLFARLASVPLLTAALLTFGCHAQQPAPGSSAAAASAAVPAGKPLSPEMQRKVEVMLRQKANLPPETVVNVGGLTPSEFPGYDTLTLTVSNEGRVSKPITFLLSRDGKTLAQINKFDISADPKNLVSAEGRPYRGGPLTAPVVIVGFDDLECPYCARLHSEIFPAITERYGDKVRIAYKDFPLDQHPWAMRAAVDTNCLAPLSNDGYWSEVDYIHAHASEIGADPKDAKAEKTLPRATEQIDKLTREQGQFRKVDMTKLNACIDKQDTTAIQASVAQGKTLGIEATPTLWVNGDKIDGAVSLDFLYGIIDQALRVAGVQPPPPYVAPKPAGPAATPAAAASPAAPTGR